MKPVAAALLALSSMAVRAESSYVSDDLILGVYAEKGQQGQRLTTLHSGASVEILAHDGEFTQIKLANGTEGWVKSSFLTLHEPAAVRLKSVEQELSRIKATTPEMAEAAARSELATLKQQLDAKQTELDAAREDAQAKLQTVAAEKPATNHGDSIGIAVIASLICAGLGFAAGYATLAQRIRNKFGGVKVF